VSLETPTPGPDSAELAAATPAASRRASLWRHPDFMKLWTAHTITQVGDEITQFALPLTAILTLDATPFQIGLLGTFQFLPFILLTIPAGVWVDRLRRRPILIGADLGRALLLVSIPVAFVTGWLTIWQLYVVGFLVGCLEVFFDIAYQSYLPSVVNRDQLVEGNAKLELSTSGTTFIGPALAGFLVEIFRAPIAIFFDALSYLGSVLFLALIRRHEPLPEPHEAEHKPSIFREAAEGLRYVLGNQYLRSIAPCTGLLNLFGNIAFTVILLYLVDELGFEPATIGLAFALGNLGVLAGALTAGRIPQVIGVGPTIVVSAMVSAVPLILVAIAPRDAALPFVAVALAIGTGSGVIYNVNQVSLRQAITPERMQGRMNATMRFIVWGTIPIGALLGGILGGLIGLQATIWVGAIGSLVGFLPVLFSPVRTLERIPEPEVAT
jgi:MFS family permease